MNEARNIKDFEVAIAAFLRQSKHQTSNIESVRDQSVGSSVQSEDVVKGKDESKHHFEASDCGVDFRHDEDKPFCRSLW